MRVLVAGLAIGGFLVLGAFEGQRRTRALLARGIALQKPRIDLPAGVAV